MGLGLCYRRSCTLGGALWWKRVAVGPCGWWWRRSRKGLVLVNVTLKRLCKERKKAELGLRNENIYIIVLFCFISR